MAGGPSQVQVSPVQPCSLSWVSATSLPASLGLHLGPSPWKDPLARVLVGLGTRWPCLQVWVATEQTRWMEVTVPSSPAPAHPLVEVLTSRDMA